MISTRTAAKVGIPVAAVGLAAALVGPSIATASSASSSSASAASSAAAAHKAAANGGSVSLTLTSPRSFHRTRAVEVNCAAADGTYTATVERKHRTRTVSVPSYDGAGTYNGETITVKAPRRTVTLTPKKPVTITSTGGSYDVNRTVRLRRRHVHVVGTASWTCSTTPSAGS